jgi:hypothetical protein
MRVFNSCRADGVLDRLPQAGPGGRTKDHAGLPGCRFDGPGIYIRRIRPYRQAGQIITRPLRGGQFFEVWRQDNATAADAAESNLHSLQRSAEVRFGKMDSQVCVNCRVLVQRLSLPDQPIQGMGRASGQFTESSRREQRLQVSEKITDQAEWIYMGTDPALEELILRKIERAVGRAER